MTIPLWTKMWTNVKASCGIRGRNAGKTWRSRARRANICRVEDIGDRTRPVVGSCAVCEIYLPGIIVEDGVALKCHCFSVVPCRGLGSQATLPAVETAPLELAAWSQVIPPNL